MITLGLQNRRAGGSRPSGPKGRRRRCRAAQAVGAGGHGLRWRSRACAGDQEPAPAIKSLRRRSGNLAIRPLTSRLVEVLSLENMNTFTESELSYLRSQRLGRLASVNGDGAPQNNPVGFQYNSELGTIDISGLNMGATRKFRNVRSHPEVALVIDDLASTDPWVVRGVEIRGVAEALDGVTSAVSGMSNQIIRIHPRRIITWGVDSDHPGMRGRDVSTSGPGE